MQRINIVYWQEEDSWLGYLQEYPDYWTQGETLEDLKEHLRDLYKDFASGEIPGICKVGEGYRSQFHGIARLKTILPGTSSSC